MIKSINFNNYRFFENKPCNNVEIRKLNIVGVSYQLKDYVWGLINAEISFNGYKPIKTNHFKMGKNDDKIILLAHLNYMNISIFGIKKWQDDLLDVIKNGYQVFIFVYHNDEKELEKLISTIDVSDDEFTFIKFFCLDSGMRCYNMDRNVLNIYLEQSVKVISE